MITHLLQAAAAENAAAEVGKLEHLLQSLLDWGTTAGKHILAALVIFIVGRFLISFINKMVARLLERRKVEPSIQSFVRSFVSILLTVLLIVAVVSKLGVETTSFAALLASAGVAVGMALSGNLQNFAGGLIVLLFKPYKVGDTVECQGETGVVREIQIFHTILTTFDNKVVYIPNGTLSSGVITNYSREELRRVDWTVGVEYGSDYDKVEATIRTILAADKRVLDKPAPTIALTALETLRLLSYHRMSQEIERLLDQGYATPAERRVLDEMYANYKDHGWNGDMDARLRKV